MTNEHTAEGMDLTQQWVAKHGMDYAYAYFEGATLPNAVEQRAYPHAALVDPDGIVVWSGHPSRLSDELIETHLAGALSVPIFEWDDAVAAVVDAIRAQELGDALRAAQRLAEEGVADSDLALTTVRRLVDAAVASAVDAFEEGNYLDALANARRHVDRLEGLDAAERLQQIIEHCTTDARAQEIVTAQQRLRALLGKRLRKKRDADSLIAQLRAMATEFEGTYVVTEVENAIAKIEGMRSRLR